MKNPEGLSRRLGEFGLTHETILRADTHKNSFIRLIAAIKTHRIVGEHIEESPTIHEQELTPKEWQLKFEPIAERIEELESVQPDTGSAFSLGLAAITYNLATFLLTLIPLRSLDLVRGIFIASILVNLVLLVVFGLGVKHALAHFNLAAKHDLIGDQLSELKRHRLTRIRIPIRRKSLKHSA